jgi:Est1 DNA/RNA binding domain
MSGGGAATPALLEDKLETAQKLSQLLAAHNQQQLQNDANKARKAAAKAEKREAIKAGRVASGMSKDDSYRPGLQSNARRRGAGKVKAPTSPLCLVAPPSMRRAVQRDAAGSGSPAVEQQRTQTVKLEQLDSVAELSTEDVLMGVARLERRHKALLEQLRAELGLDAAPPASSSADSSNPAAYYHAIPTPLWEGLQRVRSPLTRATRALVLRDLELAERKKLAHRLWMAFYKELDAVQQALKRLAADSKEQSAGGTAKPLATTPQTSPEALRALLFSMIADAEREIGSLVTSIERGEAATAEGASPDGVSLDAAAAATQGHVLQALVTAMGDLARYKQQHKPAGAEREWGPAEALYHRAFRLRPAAGKPWNQLALVATLKKDSFAAFYHYLRSLCAEEPCPARESLLTLHERCKRQLAGLKGGGAARPGGPLPLSEHTHRFLLRLLVAAGTCLSRVDLASFDGHLAAAKLHLVMSLQLQLSSSSSSTGASSSSAQDAAAQAAARRRLPAHLSRVMLLAVCTVSSCFAGALDRGMEEGQWASDPAIKNAIRMVSAAYAMLPFTLSRSFECCVQQSGLE